MDVFGIMLVISLAAGWGAQRKRGRDGATWFFLAFGMALFVVWLGFETITAPTQPGQVEPENFRNMVYWGFLGVYGAVMALAIWSLPDRRV